MATNGLVANPDKRVFTVLNKQKEVDREEKKRNVRGIVLERERSSKLIGITMDEDQK